MTRSVLVAGARTPIGKFSGALASLSSVDLGSAAIRGALENAGVDAADVELVIMGQVLQAGAGPNPARQAAAAAGIPMTTPGLTINDLCLSGLHAIAMADQQIRLGRCEVVVAGGMESMTNVPHLLAGSRGGYKYGSVSAQDALEKDALICAFDGISMGAATEMYARDNGFSRTEQDEFALRSHERSSRATESGFFKEEIVAVEVGLGRGKTATVEVDEGIRGDIDLAALAKLRPAFAPDGTITAGSSSPLSDGGAAVVVMSRDRAERLGIGWLAEIGEHGFTAGSDPSLRGQPAAALRDALARENGLAPGQLDLVEINEAFASIVLDTQRDLGLDPERVNVNGGAIALGHPVGMSGARLALTAALELRRRGGGIGAAALCGGGGQGAAIVLRSPGN